MVEYEGSSWVCTEPARGIEPPRGPWELLAKKGDDGRPGQNARFGVGGGGSALGVEDEGIMVGSFPTLDFVGPGVSVAQSGAKAIVTFDGRTAGRWEALMAPGITNPPEPLITPDGTDWVYVFIGA